MPNLFILAGPNGAEKTTFYFKAVNEGYIAASIPFINVDIIARTELGGYNEDNFVKAAEIARERIVKELNSKNDFMIESNLAKTSDYEWMSNMKKAGYNIIL